jgi:DNA adenine methylase
MDPPYLHQTRSSTGEYGEFEMTEDDHRRLLDTLVCITGRFLLSGYHSPLYDEFAADHGWHCHEREIDNKASSAKVKEKRTECVWMNYGQ